MPEIELDFITDNEAQSQLQQTESNTSRQRLGILQKIFWNGGSSVDAWLNASSFQVSQVLLNLPYSFAQMGMPSGIAFQLVYGLMGAWVSYVMTDLYLHYRSIQEKKNLENHTIQWYEVMGGLLGAWGKVVALFVFYLGISSAAMIQMVSCASAAYYINDNLDKRTWTLILGPCMFFTILVPTARNYRVWSFIGIVMTTYVAWYLTIAAAIHGKEADATHTGPHSLQHYFTGASNILYTFGGHGLTVELAGAMWRPHRFKNVYFYAVIYIFTLTIPSAVTVYWVFGDAMLNNANAFAVLPKSPYRNAAVVLIIIHQFFEFGLLMLPLCFMWEKMISVHHSRHFTFKLIARIPVFILIWIAAVMMPFFGPIDSFNGSFFTSVGVYVLPCITHMIVYRSSTQRENAKEQPASWIPMNWVGMYSINLGVVLWVVVIGVGIGGWASISNLIEQISNFGLFAKCYQCHEK